MTRAITISKMPNQEEKHPRYLRRNQYVSLSQAASEAPILAQLFKQAKQSQMMLTQISGLVPPGMRSIIQAGALENQEWCLMVPNSSVAAKLRQLTPALCAHLRTKGHDIQSIRVRIVRTT